MSAADALHGGDVVLGERVVQLKAFFRVRVLDSSDLVCAVFEGQVQRAAVVAHVHLVLVSVDRLRVFVADIVAGGDEFLSYLIPVGLVVGSAGADIDGADGEGGNARPPDKAVSADHDIILLHNIDKYNKQC